AASAPTPFPYTTLFRSGLMLIPLILGALIGTFAPGALEIGSFTTALFSDSALPLIALLIFATGTQVSARTGGPILATAGTLLLRSEEHTSELQSRENLV